MSYPIIMLSNGLRVANFSSPHPFTFEDGSILPAITNSGFDLDCHESEIDDHTIMVKFCTTPLVRANLLDWYYVYNEGLVDIVIVPRPLIAEGKNYNARSGYYSRTFNSKFRRY